MDLGHGHTLEYVGWHPDRALNPQYDGIPDIERVGASVPHPAPDGSECSGFVHFDRPEVAHVFPRHPRWTVEAEEPLTLSPSILCMRCGDHGFIREGRWVPA